jgi:creatinine amidohydrolase/Fe(II)-dependent formamide hydrolase-like protein
VDPRFRDMGGGSCRNPADSGGRGNIFNCAGTPNPIPENNTVWMEELTWMGVRDALEANRKTMIIPIGGMEPGGPWLAVGKRNFALRVDCDLLARQIQALCAPIMDLTLQGSLEPASGNLLTPGTIGLRESTFRAVLTDAIHSLKMHGFNNFIIIGGNSGTQASLTRVADSLSTLWQGVARVRHVREYSDQGPATTALRQAGALPQTAVRDNLADSPELTLTMLLADPASVRWNERVQARQATIDGVSIVNLAQALEWGRKAAEARAATLARLVR